MPSPTETLLTQILDINQQQLTKLGEIKTAIEAGNGSAALLTSINNHITHCEKWLANLQWHAAQQHSEWHKWVGNEYLGVEPPFPEPPIVETP